MSAISKRLLSLCLLTNIVLLACSAPLKTALQSYVNGSAVSDAAHSAQLMGAAAGQPAGESEPEQPAGGDVQPSMEEPQLSAEELPAVETTAEPPAPTPTLEPTPTYTPTAIPPEPTPDGCEVVFNEEFEREMLRLINEERAKAGAPPVSLSPELMAAARAHSRDMACRNYFSHNNREGLTPFDRMEAAGYFMEIASENIYAGQNVHNTPERAVRAWYNSPGHRVNMLNPEYVHIGLGYAFTKTSYFGGYYTTDFGMPK